jgi:hypothetical protein
MKKLSPVSKKYKIEFNNDFTWANVDLTDIKDTKVFFNSIINTLIVHYQNTQSIKLKGIKFLHSEQQTDEFQILCNQMNLFDLKFEGQFPKPCQFNFPNDWKLQIEEGLCIDFSSWNLLLSEFPDILTYKTVTDHKIQIRYFGYQIAKFNPKKTPQLKNIILVNNKKPSSDFKSHYNYIKNQRQAIDNTEKSEHYLESFLLKKIQNNSLNIFGAKIETLFESRLNFQFPTLLKTTPKSKTGNTPKYIDIFAKSGNSPIIFELKIHTINGTLRGAYVFEAFGQILNYFVFMNSVFSNNNENWGKNLTIVNTLDWSKTIVYVMVNDLGNDKVADKFREYIQYLKTYFKVPNFIRFVEIENDFKTDLKFIREI